MGLQPFDIETLRRYATGVICQPDPDADGVKAVTLALIGGILWQGDAGSVEIERREDGVETTLWASVNGHRLAFIYNPQTEAIDMREGTKDGHPVRSFKNRTLLDGIDRTFERPAARR